MSRWIWGWVRAGRASGEVLEDVVGRRDWRVCWPEKVRSYVDVVVSGLLECNRALEMLWMAGESCGGGMLGVVDLDYL